mmetsp:Transcript_57929/g.118547  ORF Transcript_57929/g.118547 Transcript_57929/m.118547 type:complete len:133 (+) Transcript_57929:186-584(+)|eukprot:CAMPEP_0181324244 /NCGR_PEP_ID=MMETSP1101-20121128/20248_1 /TAXON_ID=46948 /ORGANISM="Rhodomonas abbreviata, Strain Caron Lab Isolate" /LENGTH=132 /DNA_ID=CAMNT_0023432391 /DNA_START=185 /DNA_END=583 /DNA_ORIENTATION=+
MANTEEVTSNYNAMKNDDDVLYSRGSIQISKKEGIKLNWYSFPFGKSKTIDWADIVDVQDRDLSLWNTKTWGLGFDGKVWWHYDTNLREFRRKRGLVIGLSTSTWPMPGLTPHPDDFEKVKEIINQHIPAAQ